MAESRPAERSGSGSAREVGPAEFGAPWSRSLQVLTVLVFVLLTGAMAGAWLGVASPAWRAVLAVSYVALVGGCALSMVRGYRVENGAVYVRRPGRETVLSLRGLRSVERDPGAVNGSLRLLGNGGFFSFTGCYWNRRLGRYRLLASDPSRAVVLRFTDRVVVVTPSDPEAFIGRVRGASHA